MKIKILRSCSGYNFSFKQDSVVDVDKYIAEDLIGCGFAEKASEVSKRDTKPKSGGDGNADA
mgnify:CR=1 FL=1